MGANFLPKGLPCLRESPVSIGGDGLHMSQGREKIRQFGQSDATVGFEMG